jgi:sugar lactone lactonase YvrE
MTKYEPRCILRVGAELGEHPIWYAREQCLYWLDIEHHTINRFDPASGATISGPCLLRPDALLSGKTARL